ncbi:hypothetical protein MANES_15G175584v8 [Manihot esculenta]|uniref:Uncharacterized protein n=1 Tax=Manihot esculenta TaxID=3983 RepID=A0ACB7GEK7_MANES|nr:hypothetical protein MANES_15G175584v8 [Manihot esculenta]
MRHETLQLLSFACVSYVNAQCSKGESSLFFRSAGFSLSFGNGFRSELPSSLVILYIYIKFWLTILNFFCIILHVGYLYISNIHIQLP